MMQQDPETLNFEQVVGVLRRRAPLILLCCVLAAGAAYGFSKRQAKRYATTASVIFSNNSLSQQIAGLSSSGGTTAQAQQANDVELVRGGETAAKTAGRIGRGLTAEKVANSVSIAGQTESDVVDVVATSTSPKLAAVIANTYARQFVAEQQSANSDYFKSVLALVNKQLAGLTPQQRSGADGLQLENRAQTMRLLAELNYGNAHAGQEAFVPTSPVSPKTSKNVILGLLVGLFVGLGLAFLLERIDPRLRRPEDLEAIYRLPLLGVVPKSTVLARSARRTEMSRAPLPPAETEAFNLIRAHLRFFDVDRDLRTLVVASASLGDGKSTVASRLAEAAARLGSRVLLLELDLRRPTLAQQLHIQSGPGLVDVLIGAVPMGEATQSVELKGTADRGHVTRTLDVLVAGTVLPPNPAELLESHAMTAVLEQARSAYDLVVMDTPPLTVVSDALTLLRKVDGVIVVGWIGRSRRDAAEALQKVLASSGAPLLGVVANGSRAGIRDAYVGHRRPSEASSPEYSNSSSGDHLISSTTKS
jgi:succinoglycan biosynthesis transport protein ExoP